AARVQLHDEHLRRGHAGCERGGRCGHANDAHYAYDAHHTDDSDNPDHAHRHVVGWWRWWRDERSVAGCAGPGDRGAALAEAASGQDPLEVNEPKTHKVPGSKTGAVRKWRGTVRREVSALAAGASCL